MSMKIINWDSLSLEERELNLKRPTIRNLDDQKNIEEMVTEATKARSNIWTPLQDIYSAVNDAYLSLGTNTVDAIATSTTATMEVDVNIKRIVKE